ncbi:hypothetical protein G6F45_012186 [Rhizopus arrhizus]|uniref:CCHC-type domain-containing protein n=1 Tax=Rhizopus delemar (strain RA 99-880 / ATCC MYA-4621 / FGSC 9543 / NRRL 43880) TaxID=246409 RepID=I1BRR9_RHIO9|nr:hypothetical protein RO3G_03604 [Rhizopus delemar RA 99-880]KAG1617037.1 hypothetical protein G6F45_012186 [Rhizopus arrhizus]|eukprot:EIE78899.1 hypothetical protein RO3G_03604 [Rhizopus delemar RA 99-880]
MVLSNKKTLVSRGAPSVPSNLSVNPQSTNHELHSSPTSSFIAAAKGQLGPTAPRKFINSSSVTLNLNCRPSASATSAPTYISIINDPLVPSTPLTYITGSSDCSVTYTVPPSHRHLDLDFLSALRDEFPFGIGFAVQHKEDDISFPATRTFSSSLTRFNFSGIPMESPVETKINLLNIFSKYGKVVDIVLHLDDASSKWFRGNGHVLVDIADSSDDQLQPSYKVDYKNQTAILVTWNKMPVHCRYCKQMGHNRDSCPERPKENRTCYTCGIKGHLNIQCLRAPPSEPEAAKRSRHIEPASSITTRAIATPRVNKTQKHLSQSTTTITTVPVTTNDTPVEETQPEDTPEFEDIDIHQLEQILDEQDQDNVHLEVICSDDDVNMPDENTNFPAYDTPSQLPSLNPQISTTASTTTNTTTSLSNNKPTPASTRVSLTVGGLIVPVFELFYFRLHNSTNS